MYQNVPWFHIFVCTYYCIIDQRSAIDCTGGMSKVLIQQYTVLLIELSVEIRRHTYQYNTIILILLYIVELIIYGSIYSTCTVHWLQYKANTDQTSRYCMFYSYSIPPPYCRVSEFSIFDFSSFRIFNSRISDTTVSYK